MSKIGRMLTNASAQCRCRSRLPGERDGQSGSFRPRYHAHRTSAAIDQRPPDRSPVQRGRSRTLSTVSDAGRAGCRGPGPVAIPGEDTEMNGARVSLKLPVSLKTAAQRFARRGRRIPQPVHICGGRGEGGRRGRRRVLRETRPGAGGATARSHSSGPPRTRPPRPRRRSTHHDERGGQRNRLCQVAQSSGHRRVRERRSRPHARSPCRS